MASKATIQVVPQHIPSDVVTVHFEADYNGATAPNDFHVHIRKLSAFRGGKWKKVFEVPHIPPGAAGPLDGSFAKPSEPGTYDIRVVFTLDGKPIADGERTGQFFVDP